jgi:N-acetylneuraminic acid mutarotase
MYAIGGKGTGNVYHRTVFKFDSVSGQWSEVAPMPEALVNAGVCAVGSSIFVAGGLKRNAGGDLEGVNTLYKYDTEADEWNTLAPLPRKVKAVGMCEVDGKLYAVGGGAARGNYLSTLYAYDPAVNTWSTLAPMPTARASLGVFVRGGCIYVVGGHINAHGDACDAVERYDLASNTWTAVRSLPAATRTLQCCCIEPNMAFEQGNDAIFADLIARAEAVGRRRA